VAELRCESGGGDGQAAEARRNSTAVVPAAMVLGHAVFVSLAVGTASRRDSLAGESWG